MHYEHLWLTFGGDDICSELYMFRIILNNESFSRSFGGDDICSGLYVFRIVLHHEHFWLTLAATIYVQAYMFKITLQNENF